MYIFIDDDDAFAAAHHMERPEQTIGRLGSLALICNNVIGPGIMSLPAVFKGAGTSYYDK